MSKKRRPGELKPGAMAELMLTATEQDALARSTRCGLCGHLMLLHNHDADVGDTCNLPECGCET